MDAIQFDAALVKETLRRCWEMAAPEFRAGHPLGEYMAVLSEPMRLWANLRRRDPELAGRILEAWQLEEDKRQAVSGAEALLREAWQAEGEE